MVGGKVENMAYYCRTATEDRVLCTNTSGGIILFLQRGWNQNSSHSLHRAGVPSHYSCGRVVVEIRIRPTAKGMSPHYLG